MVCVPDREPGVADITWRDVDLPDDEGEKGGTCLDRFVLEMQAAASEGVTNQRKAAASGGKATVWSEIVSLAASLSAESRTILAASKTFSNDNSASPLPARGLFLNSIFPDAKETWPSQRLSLNTELLLWCHSPVSLLNLYIGSNLQPSFATNLTASRMKVTSSAEANQGMLILVAPGLSTSHWPPSMWPLRRPTLSNLASSTSNASNLLTRVASSPSSFCMWGPAQAQPPLVWMPKRSLRRATTKL